MKFKLLFSAFCLYLISISTCVYAQMNTKNPDGSYNKNAYQDWRQTQDINQYWKSAGNALDKSSSGVVTGSKSRNSSELYEPVQSAEDKAKNNSCLSGNCTNGYGTWQGSPNSFVYKYEGEFKDSLFHGTGIQYDWEGFVIKDGIWNEGRLVEGKEVTYRHENAFGDGSIAHYNTSLKDVYVGTFVRSLKEGKGDLLEFNEKEKLISTYQGEFKANRKEGKGTFVLGDEDYVSGYYVGDWKNDKREGKGIDSLNYRGVYVGFFKEDKRDGEGVAFWKHSTRESMITSYSGFWSNGEKHGFGTDFDSLGNVAYEGNFKEGKRHGEGKFFAADGTFVEGVWVEGENAEIDPSSIREPEFLLTEINEDFENGNVNKWEISYKHTLTEGSYQVEAGYLSRVTVPGQISFEPTDDWMFEVTVKKDGGPATTQWGLSWDNPTNGYERSKFKLSQFGLAWFDGGSAKDCKVKKGFNTLTVIKIGDEIEALVNGLQIHKGKANNLSTKNLYLIMDGDTTPDHFVMEYSSVIFKRL
jgi:hypothetical protein